MGKERMSCCNELRIKTRILLIIFGIILLFASMALFTFNIAGQIRDLGTGETVKVMLADQKAKIQVASHAMAIAISEAVKKAGSGQTGGDCRVYSGHD